MRDISSVFYTNDVLIRESHLGDSYMQNAPENSTLTPCKGGDQNDIDEFYFLTKPLILSAVLLENKEHFCHLNERTQRIFWKHFLQR